MARLSVRETHPSARLAMRCVPGAQPQSATLSPTVHLHSEPRGAFVALLSTARQLQPPKAQRMDTTAAKDRLLALAHSRLPAASPTKGKTPDP